VKVRVGSVLFEYTGDRAEIEAKGATLGEVLMDVETRHPGLRFRIVDEQDRVREHMNVFVGSRRTKDLGARVAPGEDVHIFQALSGG
jgi:sulfur-carrier protein